MTFLGGVNNVSITMHELFYVTKIIHQTFIENNAYSVVKKTWNIYLKCIDFSYSNWIKQCLWMEYIECTITKRCTSRPSLQWKIMGSLSSLLPFSSMRVVNLLSSTEGWAGFYMAYMLNRKYKLIFPISLSVVNQIYKIHQNVFASSSIWTMFVL